MRLSGSRWRKQSPENKVWILEPDKRWIQIHSGARVACDLPNLSNTPTSKGLSVVKMQQNILHTQSACLPGSASSGSLCFLPLVAFLGPPGNRWASGTMQLPHFSAALFRWVLVPLRAPDVPACKTGRRVGSSPQSGSCGPQGQQRAAPGAVWR